MKIRRKSNDCLNCNSRLDSIYNYCPLCGQENTNNNISFGKLITDFFSNYFALDSRFTHTLKPFFINPGYLTNKFNVGKRMSYANPVRLYLIVSLFFFFVFSHVSKHSVMDKGQGSNDFITSKSNTPALVIDRLNQEKVKDVKNVLKKDTLDIISEYLSEEQLNKIEQELSINSIEVTRSRADSTSGVFNFNFNNTDSSENDTTGFLAIFDWDTYVKIKDNLDLTEKQILDSVKTKNASDFEELFIKQIIRVNRAGKEVVIGFILKNMPLMMFLLLPIFALILKLLYIRRNRLYIKHLIHALHLHSFAYLVYGVSLLIIYYLLDSENIQLLLVAISFIVVSSYSYISFLKVYEQGWFKTLVKFNIHGAIYASLLILSLLIEMVISFLMY